MDVTVPFSRASKACERRRALRHIHLTMEAKNIKIYRFNYIGRKGKAFRPIRFGGDSRGRTGDLLNAIQALYQLSYTPAKVTMRRISRVHKKWWRRRDSNPGPLACEASALTD